jgi:hypothetical protein
MTTTPSTYLLNEEGLANYVFDTMRHILPDGQSLPKAVSQTLNLSTSTVYKKISGEAPLTVGELLTLTRQHAFSLDEYFFSEKAQVNFQYHPATPTTLSALRFYHWATRSLTEANNRLRNMEIYYAGAEMCPFHYAHFAELSAFDAITQQNGGMQIAEMHQSDFSLEQLAADPHFSDARRRYIDAYQQIPSVEFFCNAFIDRTLHALLKARHAPYVQDPATLLLICDQIEQMLLHIENMAKAGCKYDPGGTPQAESKAVTLYHNELRIVTTKILFRGADRSLFFFSLEHPNFALTIDQHFCEHTAHFFEKMQQQSHRISREGERYRARLFNRLRQSVHVVKKALKE